MEIKTLDTCTLLQACEWIALKWKPMTKIYEDAVGIKRPHLSQEDWWEYHDPYKSRDPEKQKYRDAIFNAIASLKLALHQGEIHATGILNESEKPRKNLVKRIQATEITTNDKFKLRVPENIITIPISDSETKEYRNVEIPFVELQKVFPVQKVEQPAPTPAINAKTGYTTPYLEIMHEVIAELGITDTNQLTTKVIKPFVAQKLEARGIYTGRLASLMTTAIRLPESKKGGNKPYKNIDTHIKK